VPNLRPSVDRTPLQAGLRPLRLLPELRGLLLRTTRPDELHTAVHRTQAIVPFREREVLAQAHIATGRVTARQRLFNPNPPK
jgi:hypothetical protein